MFKRPQKKDLSSAEMQKILDASAKQTGGLSSPKTYDPDYPLFDTPINKKVLVYIPNHTVVNEDGSVELMADRYTSHTVRLGKAYTDVRCCGELVNDSLGWNGTCPLCDATTLCWDLYNLQLAEIAATKGINKDAPEAEDLLSEDRKKLLGEMAIKASEKWITFPFVVIDCVDGKTIPKKNAKGEITGTPMFYSIREITYDDKWVKAFDALEEEGDGGEVDMNPAGRWAILNFTYTPKTGTHNKRDSARNLVVSFRKMEGYGQWEKYFDELTKEWTPQKAMDVLVRNSIRSMEEMEEVCEEIIKPVREKLAKYELAGNTLPATAGGGTAVAGADNALANFGAEPVNEDGAGALPAGTGAEEVGEMPNVAQ